MLFGGHNAQNYITDVYPMPISDIGSTTFVTTMTETVEFYYFLAGVPTIDAGQSAGTIVVGNLKYDEIQDRMGAYLGNDEETSFVWTTGTVLPMANIRVCPKYAIEDLNNKTLYKRALEVTKNFANGDWCLDHRSGLIFGKKATTGISDVATYKVKVPYSVGGGGVASDVNVTTRANVISTTALASSLVVKASAGALVGFSGINNSASDQYIQVFNSATVPADTTVPIISIKVEAGENFGFSVTTPISFSAGISISNSSTIATKTIGSADCWIQAEFI